MGSSATPNSKSMTRCPWADSHPLLLQYHDLEWGVPAHDERHLFEMLVLEGAQAGLRWLSILKRRDAYRTAFSGFDAKRVARFASPDIDRLLDVSSGIIRNRRKVDAAIRMASTVLAITGEFGSLDRYFWRVVDGRPMQNRWKASAEIPGQTEISAALSSDLIARGGSFVGPTVCYAFMQACGLVNDHLVGCFRYQELR